MAGVGRLDEAAAALEQALRQTPSASGAWVELARVHLRQGRRDDAATAAFRARELAPESALVTRLWSEVEVAGR
ncbi:MAG: tetratricopeptide repeat protein [Candidatus Eisenbacteria bacterium]|nr:tetratricopeptide repeat protein [Candidatus Eisenbacteria bacterium]